MIYALIAIVTLVTVLQLLIRTNSAVVFLAVCAGSVLLNAAGKDTNLLAYSVGSTIRVSDNAVQAVFILLPALISAFLFRKRVAKSKVLFVLIPAFCASVAAISLIYPFLSGSFQATLQDSEGWSLIAQYYEFILVIGIFSSLIALAITMPKNHDGKHHKKGKH